MFWFHGLGAIHKCWQKISLSAGNLRYILKRYLSALGFIFEGQAKLACQTEVITATVSWRDLSSHIIFLIIILSGHPNGCDLSLHLLPIVHDLHSLRSSKRVRPLFTLASNRSWPSLTQVIQTGATSLYTCFQSFMAFTHSGQNRFEHRLRMISVKLWNSFYKLFDQCTFISHYYYYLYNFCMYLFAKYFVNTDNVKECIVCLEHFRCATVPRALLTGAHIIILNFLILLRKRLHFQRPRPASHKGFNEGNDG